VELPKLCLSEVPRCQLQWAVLVVVEQLYPLAAVGPESNEKHEGPKRLLYEPATDICFSCSFQS